MKRPMVHVYILIIIMVSGQLTIVEYQSVTHEAHQTGRRRVFFLFVIHNTITDEHLRVNRKFTSMVILHARE